MRLLPPLFLAALALAGCREAPSGEFPQVERKVAPIVSGRFSTEDARDRVGEAETVIAFAGVEPGMFVADIGAGEGYYTVRLSPVVGPSGRVLAQDIIADTRTRLAQRVQREGLDNVAVRLGEPADPKLPAASFDRIFLVHMYHEVTQPYEFLWNLREGLKEDGLIVVVDADRPVKRHGMPPEQLDCELGSLGLERVEMSKLQGTDSYMALFRIAAPRPDPGDIETCPYVGNTDN